MVKNYLETGTAIIIGGCAYSAINDGIINCEEINLEYLVNSFTLGAMVTGSLVWGIYDRLSVILEADIDKFDRLYR